jgi:hypothetical protein
MPQLAALALHRCIRRSPTFAAIALFLIAMSPASARAEACFDDQQLTQLIAESSATRGTMIYVWSPRMVYSVQNMALAARAAGAAGLAFVALHEGEAPEQASGSQFRWTEPRSRAGPLPLPDLATPPYFSLTEPSQRLCSPRLNALEALRHFPTAFVLSGQRIHRFPIVGAMPYEAWVSSIAQRLNEDRARP